MRGAWRVVREEAVMVKRWLLWIFGIGLIPLLPFCCYDLCNQLRWLGSTDLEIEFVVTDAAIGQPIKTARIDIDGEDSFCDEERTVRKPFHLLTDAEGIARKECRNARCIGTRSGFGWSRDTRHVYLPCWHYSVSAPGYETSEWTFLDIQENNRQIQHLGPGKDKLTVPILLQKTATK